MIKRYYNQLYQTFKRKMEGDYATVKVDSISTSMIGEKLSLQAWITSFQDKKGIYFAHVHDGTVSTLQLVFDKKNFEEKFESDLHIGTNIKVYGTLVKSHGNAQEYEVLVDKFDVCGSVKDPRNYPFSGGMPSEEYLRTIPHLRTSTPQQIAVQKIRSALKFGMAQYYQSKGIPEVQVPLLTDNQCESGSEAFKATTLLNQKLEEVPVTPDGFIDYSKDFFGKPVSLTVSGQFHLEAFATRGIPEVYCTTTAFRAEPSHSKVHLAEFWMTEYEGCTDKLEDIMAVAENSIKAAYEFVLQTCQKELQFLESYTKKSIIATVEKYVSTKWAVISHEEAVTRMLKDIESGVVTIDPEKKTDDIFIFKEKPKLDGDLTKDHERFACEVICGGIPTFILYYPAAIKAFYMPKINKGDETERARNFDCVFPGSGEVIGGSMRENDADELLERMKEVGIDPNTLAYYIALRQMGSPPHGGFGIGFDRLVTSIIGLDNVRDSVPFPRTPGSCLL